MVIYKEGVGMVKNNLKSLMSHIVISLLSLVVFMIFHSSAAKWASEESARRHHNFMVIISLIVICISLLLYYYSGRAFCTSGKGILNNITSFSAIAVIGIILWIIAFSIDPIGFGGNLLNSNLWFNYATYNNYSIFFLYETRINNPYIFLIFSLIPSIAMYLGMKRKVV